MRIENYSCGISCYAGFRAHAVGKLSQSVNLPTARDYKSGVTDTSVINCSLFTINYQKFFILH